MTQQELNQLPYEEKLSFCLNVCRERLPDFVNSDPQFYFALQVIISHIFYSKGFEMVEG